jgi:predicted nicotinamide N-methyase
MCDSDSQSKNWNVGNRILALCDPLPQRGEVGVDDLLEQVRQKYEVASGTVRFGELSFDFWRVADPETVLDEETLQQSHAELPWQPYWAETWDTAYGVAMELAERSLEGLRVLDLGCGLGLTGTVAAARGAEVVMADYAPPALSFARLNSWPWRERVQVLRVNWRTDDLGQRFDLIVGSDILYDREDLPYLDVFFRSHLEPQGTVLLGEPSRLLTREFIQWIRQHGWHLQESCRQVPQSDRPIRLVELQRSADEEPRNTQNTRRNFGSDV